MQSKPQLFCFTYAGGTVAFFDVIEKDLEGIELVGLEYAGHGERHREEYYKDFDELADDMYKQLSSRYRGGEYALFGYSMGSISLVEVLKRILTSGMKKPISVFLSAHEPHTRSELLDFAADELDDWVKERTVRFGAVPERILHNKVFWRTYLPVYRADYTIIGKYQFELLEIKTDIPAVVFYSETDTPLSDMQLWEKYFPCEYHQYQGTHFFIREHHVEMAKIIREKMGGNHDI